MPFACFIRFEIELPDEAVADIATQGKNDEAVAYWAPRIVRPASVTPEKLSAELKEYGAWDEEERADDDANWQRIIWCAAWNIHEEKE